MSATFRIIGGARAGVLYSPAGGEFLAGRAPEADLRFDPEHDLAVSGRHARFRRQGAGWTVQDLDSRNGTFLNGRRLTAETPLREGDRVAFGRDGPAVEFSLRAPSPAPLTRRPWAAGRREGNRAGLWITVLLAAVVLAGSALVVLDLRARSARDRERALLEQRIDSLVEESRRTEAALASEVAGLNAALRESQRSLERLRAELRRATATGEGDTEDLRRELLAAQAALGRQQLAASLDFRAIERRARAAVAMLWVEDSEGERVTGTALGVHPDGLLVTNRHLVHGAAGDRRPARMAVRFTDSDQAFPARLVAVSREWDLALLAVDKVVGEVPSAADFNMRLDTLAPGSPVALIGYPLGGEPERDPATVRRVARPILSAGLLLDADDDAVAVQGLGAAGASGTPILDSTGEIIAILFGGRREDGVQVLLGLPAPAVAAFLEEGR